MILYPDFFSRPSYIVILHHSVANGSLMNEIMVKQEAAYAYINNITHFRPYNEPGSGHRIIVVFQCEVICVSSLLFSTFYIVLNVYSQLVQIQPVSFREGGGRL